jgi:hypothetical protein
MANSGAELKPDSGEYGGVIPKFHFETRGNNQPQATFTGSFRAAGASPPRLRHNLRTARSEVDHRAHRGTQRQYGWPQGIHITAQSTVVSAGSDAAVVLC